MYKAMIYIDRYSVRFFVSISKLIQKYKQRGNYRYYYFAAHFDCYRGEQISIPYCVVIDLSVVHISLLQLLQQYTCIVIFYNSCE